MTRALWCKVLVLLLLILGVLPRERAREDCREHHDKKDQGDSQIQIWSLPVHTDDLGPHHGDEAKHEPSDGPHECGRRIFRKERRLGGIRHAVPPFGFVLYPV